MKIARHLKLPSLVDRQQIKSKKKKKEVPKII
jgi:hypothetical protein